MTNKEYLEMKHRLAELSVSQLCHLYEQHCQVFRLEYAEPADRISEYKFRKIVLSVLDEKLEEEFEKTLDKINQI